MIAAGVLAVGLLAAAIYQIYRPGRPFWHYLMFLLVPAGMALIAWMIWPRVRSSASRLTKSAGNFLMPFSSRRTSQTGLPNSIKAY